MLFWYRFTDTLMLLIAVFCALILVGLLTRRIRVFAVDSTVGGKYITEYVVAVGNGNRYPSFVPLPR